MTIAFRSVVMGTVALAGVALAKPALADTLSAQQLLGQFNTIVLGTLTSNSGETDGRAFVGGNLNGSTFSAGGHGVVSSPYNALIVDGDVDTSNLAVGGGGFNIGGSVNGTLNGNGASAGTTSSIGKNVNGNVSLNGTLQVGGIKTANGNVNNAAVTYGAAVSTDPLPVSVFGTLNALSATLAGLAPTGTVTQSNGVLTFTAQQGATGTVIFNISASQLDEATAFSFDLGKAQAIINVTGGGSITDNVNATGNPQDLLWNFGDATSLDIVHGLEGTVLATDADVTISANMEGTLVAGDATLDAEIHSDPFAGTLPDGGTTPVPEPASGAVVLAGLGMLAMLRRRRVL